MILYVLLKLRNRGDIMVYLGGKKKIAKFIYPIIQKELDSGEYDAYIEPFGGGGNIMENINFPLRYFYDINKYLIAFYNKLKEGWDIPEPNSFNADHYNEVRKSWKEKDGKYPDWYYGYMMFVPSYNGKMWGSFAKDGSRLYQQEHYLSVINNFPKIKDCIFENKDYTDIKCKNSVIYCDPPYSDSQRNYYDCDFNHNNFYDWCRVMSKDNKIFISETQMPNDFKVVWEKPYKRALANQTKAIKTVEKLFTL